MLLAGARPGIIDDTYITFHYARTLAETGLLSWHPDLPRVDGFTSLGHTLLLALALWLGGEMLAVNSLLNLAAAGGLLVTVACLSRGMPVWARLVAVAVVALNASLLFWVSAGLDAVLYALAFVLAYAAVERAEASGSFGPATAAALAALALMRPEGMLIAAGVVAFFWAGRAVGRPRASRAAPVWSGLVVAILAGLVAWRVAEYGHPLPNAVYAKRSASLALELAAGATYLANWIVLAGGFILLASPLAVALGSGRWLRLLFVLGQVALVLVAGGDPHGGFRFILPILPLLALDLAWLLARAPGALRAAAALLAACTIAIQAPLVLGPLSPGDAWSGLRERVADGRWPLRRHADEPVTAARADASRHLAAALAPGTPVAATDVGALAYFSRLPVVDILGLNDPATSHLSKPAGVPVLWGVPHLGRAIEAGVPVVHVGFPGADDWRWQDVAEGRMDICPPRMVWITPARGYDLEPLGALYSCASLPVPDRPGHWINVFVRKGAAAQTLRRPAEAELSACLAAVRAVCGDAGR